MNTYERKWLISTKTYTPMPPYTFSLSLAPTSKSRLISHKTKQSQGHKLVSSHRSLD